MVEVPATVLSPGLAVLLLLVLVTSPAEWEVEEVTKLRRRKR